MQLKPNVDTIRKSHHLAPEVVSRPWGRQDVLPAMRHSSDLMHGPRPRLLSYGERILQQYAAQTKRGRAQKITLSQRSTTGIWLHGNAPSPSLSLKSTQEVSMVTLSTALPLLQAASTRKKFQSTVAHLGCRLRPPSRKVLYLRKEGSQNDCRYFRGRVIPREPTGNRRCRVQTLGRFSVITVNLLVSNEPGGLCSMPSRVGAPSSTPTHCQRDREREAHARSSRRDAEAACSAETV